MLFSLLYLTVKQLGRSEFEREEVSEVCDLWERVKFAKMVLRCLM